ncbi:12409_t:CDS:2, partial [Funneliformis geosporum]
MNPLFLEQTIPDIVVDLLSYDESAYKRVLDHYFTDDAALSHPFLTVNGTHNIRKVFRVWTTFNKQEPEFQREDIIFDGAMAVVSYKQHLRPRIFPLIHFVVPSITTLRFHQENDGLLYICKQEDSWTLEGLIQSVPLVNWFYENLIRKLVVGRLITGTVPFDIDIFDAKMQDIDIGTEFSPYEPYTHRLRKILEEEYPDGSQVIREILQNSDDAGSTEQIFILDHNTYQSNSLLQATFKNLQRPNLKLDRYQGPALLAKNTSTFGKRDFQSLLKLADSEKRDQYDKIGVMGVGFNSIYHITDSPSFITGDKYVILDPHKWCFNGGIRFEFVEKKLSERYPDQFAPFNIPCDKPFDGTIFRYPLRTKEDSADSEISNKVYKPEEILDMFHKFYNDESINCLLFLKYIERISFYELKKDATKLESLYTIELENADKVREQRRLLAEKIGPMMTKLKLGQLKGNNQLVTSYVASFCRQKNDDPEKSSWLILNYLDDLLETDEYFHENFKKNIRDHKFIPNVGLAIPLKDIKDKGKLFCFLPLPIHMPFPVSVHGYFAKFFSKPQDCHCQKDKDLVCLFAPILESEVKNNNFLNHLKWNTYPDVEKVIKQYELCYDGVFKKKPQKNLEKYCHAIYKYMNEICQVNDKNSKEGFNKMKKVLENKPWILCKKTFYSVDKVVFRLQREFQVENFLIVELPIRYTSEFMPLFKTMGVREEVGIKDLVLIIKNISIENVNRNLSEDDIFQIIQILEQISKIQRSSRRGGNNPENLDGLLIPSNKNELNADDAKATRFSVILDERPKFQHEASKKSLLSDEMDSWQGPAIWIYNDAEFSEDDFQALIKLGVGGKSKDINKIGRFGLGFNCAFNITDLPSLVSGKHIVFLDPHAKFLPSIGYPPIKRKESCDFSKQFKGTLFRLPLRTEISDISNRIIEIKEILQLFNSVQGNKEMIFLRNIESFNLYNIKEQEPAPQLIWQAQIKIKDNHRDIRKRITDTFHIYQFALDIKKFD